MPELTLPMMLEHCGNSSFSGHCGIKVMNFGKSLLHIQCYIMRRHLSLKRHFYAYLQCLFVWVVWCTRNLNWWLQTNSAVSLFTTQPRTRHGHSPANSIYSYGKAPPYWCSTGPTFKNEKLKQAFSLTITLYHKSLNQNYHFIFTNQEWHIPNRSK